MKAVLLFKKASICLLENNNIANAQPNEVNIYFTYMIKQWRIQDLNV